MTTRDVNYNFGNINYTIKSPNISGVGTFDLEPAYGGPTTRLPEEGDTNLDSIHRYIVRDDYGNVVVDVPLKDRKIQTPDAVSKKSAAMHNYYNQTKPIAYKYNEGETLQDITDYVNKTYGEHYSQNKFQSTEFIIDSGHGEGFCIGNMLKYTQRYGRKGDHTEWRKDLFKVIHYAIMMLHVHDQQHNNKEYKIEYRN
jgi:hypothetical protein